ncbi:MAG: glutaredoxin family protein [Bacteroidota bacterium]
MAQTSLKLFGADWCTKSSFLKNYLQSEWIEFEYYNVEKDAEAAEEVKALYDGKLKFPTIKVGDEHLKNPSISELKPFLKAKGFME